MPEDQNQPNVSIDTSQPTTQPEAKPDYSNFVPKGQFTEAIKEKAELEARIRALQEDREALKSRSLSQEEWEAYQDRERKKEERAAQRKKDEGRFDEILKENEAKYNTIIEQQRREHAAALEKERRDRAEIENRFKRQTLEGYVKGVLKEVAAEDVVDIVARELIQGYSTAMKIDLDSDGNPVVLDRTTNNPAWSSDSGGRVSVRDYVHSFIDKRPSFKKANVSRGSDSGIPKSNAPDLSGDRSKPILPEGKPAETFRDGSMPIGLPKSAKGLSLIKESLDERSRGGTGGFKGFHISGNPILD